MECGQPKWVRAARDAEARDLIVRLTAHHRVPAVYSFRLFAQAGGLISYGINATEQFPRAASYVDRILKGEKPADLPVLQPTKLNFVINQMTAKALGLEVPSSLQAWVSRPGPASVCWSTRARSL